WNDLGKPNGVNLIGNPAVAAYAVGGTVYVDTYVVGADFRLKDFVFTNDGSGWASRWNDLGENAPLPAPNFNQAGKFPSARLRLCQNLWEGWENQAIT